MTTSTASVTALHLVDHDRIDVHRENCRDIARTIAKGRSSHHDRVDVLGTFTVEREEPEQILRDALLEAADPDDLGYREITEIRYLPCC